MACTLTLNEFNELCGEHTDDSTFSSNIIVFSFGSEQWANVLICYTVFRTTTSMTTTATVFQPNSLRCMHSVCSLANIGTCNSLAVYFIHVGHQKCSRKFRMNVDVGSRNVSKYTAYCYLNCHRHFSNLISVCSQLYWPLVEYAIERKKG